MWFWRGTCIVLGINHQSHMLILPWPCAACGGNNVCGAKDNSAAFVLAENNTADDAAALCYRCCHPRSHVALSNITRPDNIGYCKDAAGLMHSFVFTLYMHYCGSQLLYLVNAKKDGYVHTERKSGPNPTCVCDPYLIFFLWQPEQHKSIFYKSNPSHFHMWYWIGRLSDVLLRNFPSACWVWRHIFFCAFRL